MQAIENKLNSVIENEVVKNQLTRSSVELHKDSSRTPIAGKSERSIQVNNYNFKQIRVSVDYGIPSDVSVGIRYRDRGGSEAVNREANIVSARFVAQYIFEIGTIEGMEIVIINNESSEISVGTVIVGVG